tara:strand:- start:391 stop:798 length:408 start_codon:yes stop_codon:yes gene_type:complete
MDRIQKKFLECVILILLSNLFISESLAVEPEEFLQDKKQELLARNISKQIRCLVCQNQSIDESSAPLAKDLRILIRKKIVEGKTEEEIYDYLKNRYGEFILLKPPFQKTTLILWLFPFLIFAAGILIIFKYNKKE